MQAEPVVIQLQRETRSSIELTRNARGEYGWVIKLYCEGGDMGSGVDVLQDVDQALRRLYLVRPEG